ncbi:MAG: M48 family metalloprotease [Planctomycetota bacterium]|jgi:Zn-dependent protease with chaperone function
MISIIKTTIDAKGRMKSLISCTALLVVIGAVLISTATACAAPQQAKSESSKEVKLAKQDAPSNRYRQSYRSEHSLEIEMPEWEEAVEESAPPAGEPKAEEAIEAAPKEVKADEMDEPPVIEEPVAEAPQEATAVEKAPQAEPESKKAGEQEDPFAKLGGAAWEEDFVKDMQGIKDEKLGRSDLTEDLVRVFPLGDEIIMGEGIAARVLAGTPELDNLAIWQYVNFIGMSLAEHSIRNELPYYFIVLDASEDINAFAAPGGFVFITTGAIRLCRNEAELASILAHEIAHVGHRHGIGMLDLSKYRLMMKSIVNEMDAAFGESEFFDLEETMSHRLREIENELSGIADQCFEQILNPFSQEMEFEADEEGLRLMKAAGYNPYAAIDILVRLKDTMGDIPAYAKALHSHPPTRERIEGLRKIAKTLGLTNMGRLHEERFKHHLELLGDK